MDCDLKIKYYPKASLGTDRIANCVAAYTIYKKDCLVIDFGTAITYNAVSKQGVFQGGLITCGIQGLYDILPTHLKLLNKKTKGGNQNTLALTTSQAVKSGLYYSVIGVIEKIKSDIQKNLNKKLYIIATGGGANFIPNLKHILNDVDVNLTLKGLAIIYQRIIKGRNK